MKDSKNWMVFVALDNSWPQFVVGNGNGTYGPAKAYFGIILDNIGVPFLSCIWRRPLPLWM